MLTNDNSYFIHNFNGQIIVIQTTVDHQSRQLTYSNEYDKLMTDEGFAFLSRLLEAGSLIVGYEVSDFRKTTYEGITYHSLTVDTEKSPADYASFLHIVYVDAKEMEGVISSDFGMFPIMLIVFPSNVDVRGAGYHSFEVTLEHELMHLTDLKKIFDTDPGLIQRSIQYALTNIKESDNVSESTIEKCIMHEVEKIFLIEPQAMMHDYDAGENRIPIPFLFSMIEFKCRSGSEYIKMKVHSYLSIIKSEIRKLATSKSLGYDDIDSAFCRALDLYGQDVFGENASAQYKSFSDDWFHLVMDRAFEDSKNSR